MSVTLIGLFRIDFVLPVTSKMGFRLGLRKQLVFGTLIFTDLYPKLW
jgi:hypothetical protein